MPTIAENLQRLVDAKSDIADAITAKGGTVNQGDGFEEFPADIASIPSGGGGSVDYTVDFSCLLQARPKPKAVDRIYDIPAPVKKEWHGSLRTVLMPNNGEYVWSDGNNVYYSDNSNQYVLNKETSTWKPKTWNGLTSFRGNNVWSDGTNIVYSSGSNQYILDKSASTWSSITWNGLTSFTGSNVWHDHLGNTYVKIHNSSSNETFTYKLNVSNLTCTKMTTRWGDTTRDIAYDPSDMWIGFNRTNNTSSYYGSQYYLRSISSTSLAWTKFSWSGSVSAVEGKYVWSDGSTIYFSQGSTQRKYDSGWYNKKWYGLTNFYGNKVWTDGIDYYYSDNSNQYVLNKETSTWEAITWGAVISFEGKYIWSDGINIYYSYGSDHCILDKTTDTWIAKSWSGAPNDVVGNKIWSDGINIYYSSDTIQYTIDVSNSTWSAKSWSGLTSFNGDEVWSDGVDVYYSFASTQMVLNKATSTWSAKSWSGLTSFNGDEVWSYGDNVFLYYSNIPYVLDKTTSTWTLIGDLSFLYNIIKATDGVNTYGSTSTSYSDIWTDGECNYYSYGLTQYRIPKATIVTS